MPLLSSLLSTDWVLSQFGSAQRSAQVAYRRLVEEGIGSTAWEYVCGGLLGKAGCAENMRPLLTERAEATDAPLRERVSARPPLPGSFEGLESGERRSPTAPSTPSPSTRHRADGSRAWRSPFHGEQDGSSGTTSRQMLHGKL